MGFNDLAVNILIPAGPYRGVDGEKRHEEAHYRPPRHRRGEHGGAGAAIRRRRLIGKNCVARTPRRGGNTLPRDERGGGDSGEGRGEQQRRESERQSQA